MNPQHISTVQRTGAAELTLATNKLIRNTYILLSLTLGFSAIMAVVSMAMNGSHGGSLVCSIGAIAMLWFVLPRFANSTAGIGLVFVITGLLGFGLGPMLNYYAALPNGSQIIATAFGGTAAIFLGLSGYAMVTRKDFSFMGGFLVMGILVVLVAMLGNMFFQIPALSLALSAAIIFIMGGFILYDTSRMVNGGETNYVLATIGLYIAILNIFTSLLHILGVMGGDD
jgi:modulator of FtsH protease